jgi:lysozyme family protein
MRINRERVIELVFGSEKGYVNRESDAGGPTNMGITQRTLSAWRGHAVSIADVQNLQKAEAWDIYASEYWTPIKGDALPGGLDYCLFDSCVTSGPNRAARILQEVLVAGGAKIGIDGNIGAETIAAIADYPGGVVQLIEDYCHARVAWMQTLTGPKGFPANGRGWTIRVLGEDPKGLWAPVPGVIGNALHLARRQIPAIVPQNELPDEATAKARDSSVGLKAIASKPEAIGTMVAAGTGVITAASANSILSYALAAVIVTGAVVAGYYFIHRIRAGA